MKRKQAEEEAAKREELSELTEKAEKCISDQINTEEIKNAADKTVETGFDTK